MEDGHRCARDKHGFGPVMAGAARQSPGPRATDDGFQTAKYAEYAKKRLSAAEHTEEIINYAQSPIPASKAKLATQNAKLLPPPTQD